MWGFTVSSPWRSSRRGSRWKGCAVTYMEICFAVDSYDSGDVSTIGCIYIHNTHMCMCVCVCMLQFESAMSSLIY